MEKSSIDAKEPTPNDSYHGYPKCQCNAHRSSHNLRNRLLLDPRFLTIRPRYPEVCVAEVGTLHIPEELLVVRNDDQLEIRLLLPSPDDIVQRLGKRPDIVAIQVRRRLVQCNQSALDPEAFGQRQPDDDAGQHPLPSTTPPAHVHLRVLLDHAHSIFVRSVFLGRLLGRLRLVVRSDENSINVGPLICSLPQLFSDSVDFLHLQAVIPHYCPTMMLVFVA